MKNEIRHYQISDFVSVRQVLLQERRESLDEVRRQRLLVVRDLEEREGYKISSTLSYAKTTFLTSLFLTLSDYSKYNIKSLLLDMP